MIGSIIVINDVIHVTQCNQNVIVLMMMVNSLCTYVDVSDDDCILLFLYVRTCMLFTSV